MRMQLGTCRKAERVAVEYYIWNEQFAFRSWPSRGLGGWTSDWSASRAPSTRRLSGCWGSSTPDGYWCGELEADSMLEADYIFMHTLLGTGDRGKMERAINEILRHQNADGGWSIYPNGPSNVFR